jgi:hypothetical protein
MLFQVLGVSLNGTRMSRFHRAGRTAPEFFLFWVWPWKKCSSSFLKISTVKAVRPNIVGFMGMALAYDCSTGRLAPKANEHFTINVRQLAKGDATI